MPVVRVTSLFGVNLYDVSLNNKMKGCIVLVTSFASNHWAWFILRNLSSFTYRVLVISYPQLLKDYLATKP